MKRMMHLCGTQNIRMGLRISRQIYTNGSLSSSSKETNNFGLQAVRYLNSNSKETTHFGFKTVAADEKAKLVEDVFSKVRNLYRFLFDGCNIDCCE
jgi:hypothetical protein